MILLMDAVCLPNFKAPGYARQRRLEKSLEMEWG